MTRIAKVITSKITSKAERFFFFSSDLFINGDIINNGGYIWKKKKYGVDRPDKINDVMKIDEYNIRIDG
ncbi:MAG: hypothetical protein ACLFSL_04675, partial [Candidatus Woesearchaeota archaeon]